MNSNIRTMALSVMKKYQGEDYIFPDEIYDYLTELCTLEKVEVDVNSKAYSHKQFLKNLLVFESSFRIFSNKFISEDKIKPFVEKLESMFSDYKRNNLKNQFFLQRKTHYSRLAFNK